MARRLVVVVLLALLLASPAAAGPRITALDWVNAYRAERDAPALVLGHRISAYAQDHAEAMHRAGVVYHSERLDEACPAGWTMAGENVGAGASLSSVLRAMRASPPHRRNLLRPRWDKLGVGVLRHDGTAWVVLVFCDVPDSIS